MANGKILYFVRPEAKRPIQEPDVHYLAQMARKTQEDSLARRHFDDLLKGIWPTSQPTPA